MIVVGGMAVTNDVVNDDQDDSRQHSKKPDNEHLQDYLNHDCLLSSIDQSLHTHYPASRMPNVKCQTFARSLRLFQELARALATTRGWKAVAVN
jgi:hypothetical protein